MTLGQMSTLKRWHVAHRDHAPLECQAWDLVLTLWVLGWMGLPPALLLHWTWLVAACVPMYCAPPLYVRLRSRLHRRGALRCDWLAVLAQRAG